MGFQWPFMEMKEAAFGWSWKNWLPGALSHGETRLAGRRVGASELGRRAKFYRLTRAGRQQLASHTAAWVAFSAAVNRALVKAVQS